MSLIGFIRRPTQNWGVNFWRPVGRRLLAQMGLVAKVIEDAWTTSIQHDLVSSISRGIEEVVGRRTIQLSKTMQASEVHGTDSGELDEL